MRNTVSSQMDRWILFLTVFLIGFGLLMVASASMVISDRQFGYPFFYFYHQLITIAISMAAGYIASRVPVSLWYKMSGVLLVFGLLLLVLVLVPGIGKVVNGSRRWLHLGLINLQVSEFAKLFSLLYLSGYLQRYADKIKTDLFFFVKPMAIFLIMACLLLMEPDFGATTVMAIIFLSLLFVAGVRILGDDRPGMLNDITRAISSYMNTNIRSVNIDSQDSMFQGLFVLNVKDTEHLNRILEVLVSHHN